MTFEHGFRLRGRTLFLGAAVLIFALTGSGWVFAGMVLGMTSTTWEVVCDVWGFQPRVFEVQAREAQEKTRNEL